MRRLFLWLVIAAVFSPMAAAQPALSVAMPPDAQNPTPVWIGLDDLRVFSIEEQDEVYQLGGRLLMRWVDPRQAFDPESVGNFRLELQGEAATDMLDEAVWWPEIEFVDAVGSRDRMAVNLTLDADGEVWYRERFLVDVKQDFYLGDFPFDQHVISFTLEPFTYGSSAVRFVGDESSIGTSTWEPTEWVVGEPVLELSDGVSHVCRAPDGAEEGPFDGGCDGASQCQGGTVCEERYGFTAMTVSMDVARVSSHYIGNIILPLVLIVLITTAVFWMDPGQTHLGDRLMLAFTSLLTVVAFDLVTSGSLPKLWYSTVLDRIVTASYVFVAVTIAFAVVIDQLDRGRHAGRGQTLNKILRWVFPAAYVVGVAILILAAA